MRVLAIETSCDETGVAIAEGQKTPSGGFSFTLLGAAALNSQAALHAQFGGVYPNLAKREHEKNLPIILKQALDQAGHPKVDAIAVTQGPGLEPALWTGITFAEKLAKELNVPLLPTNHMEGHLVSSLAQRVKNEESELTQFALENVELPVLALLISGGHTEFDLMREWFRYEIVGQTLDDAVGEAYDKVARMLGLPYPGGPHISKLAQEARIANAQIEIHTNGQSNEASKKSSSREPEEKAKEKSPGANGLASLGRRPDRDLRATRRPEDLREGSFSLELPRPMLRSNTCDFSFSGLKTAALYSLRDLGGAEALSPEEKAAFAREFEDAVTEVFVAKTRKALIDSGAKTFVIGGGVAANVHIRMALESLIRDEFPDVDLRLPELSITGDNAVMIAEAALLRALSGLDDTPKGEVRAYSNRFSMTAPQ